MMDRQFYVQEINVPQEFLQYEKSVKQLGVGQTGKTGILRILLKREPRTNRTIAEEIVSEVPLQVQKILYVEESCPEMAYVYIMSPSGGILQGDRLKVNIKLKKDTCAHITTQAATKIYRMNSNYATQTIDLTVEEHCYLEFMPDQLIPYRSSRYFQHVTLKVHESSTVVYCEIIAPGRVASNELFEYDICCLKTVAQDQNALLRFRDTLLLEPKKQQSLFNEFGLEQKPVFANMYVLTKVLEPKLLSDAVHDTIAACSVYGSASALPRNDGIFTRFIAETAPDVKEVVDTILHEIRNQVLSKPFTGARKY